MREFKVTFIKSEKVITNKTGPVRLAEQKFITDKESFEIKCPDGFIIMSVVELLPPVIFLKTVKK
jgi:hypothetical protein